MLSISSGIKPALFKIKILSTANVVLSQLKFSIFIIVFINSSPNCLSFMIAVFGSLYKVYSAISPILAKPCQSFCKKLKFEYICPSNLKIYFLIDYYILFRTKFQ